MTMNSLPTLIEITTLAFMVMGVTTMNTALICLMLTMFTSLLSILMSTKIQSNIYFIVFLVTIGGIMIIFLYYTSCSIHTNKSSYFNLKSITITMIISIPVIINTKKVMSHTELNSLFQMNISKFTIMLVMFMMMILMGVIKAHAKVNFPFRRNLKIWG